MKYLAITLSFLFSPFLLKAQSFKTDKLSVHFFAAAPVADIDALTNSANAILDIKRKEIKVNIPISAFSFKKALMQQHFNEKYIESDKYPSASFKGNFKDDLTHKPDGTYLIYVEGKFNLHGVDVLQVIPCKITIQKNVLTVNSSFVLNTKDFKIEPPKILTKPIGEKIEVTVNGNLNKAIN
ncbi:YceI-like domain protein [Pedobacter glucosidilyticus]|uniref:YceI family protein n=1 Tax=Pedobacter aquae TaxID=2605747 RepID=A0A5C0VIL2_9SPHI|nr:MULTISPECIES: YceI family protein [Pedobacter]KHJ38376.1 YceI-like domain protein [Pedobacter glucosidilyticus]QEK51531.1 YceI family protein [Pedobacter aquae]